MIVVGDNGCAKHQEREGVSVKNNVPVEGGKNKERFAECGNWQQKATTA